MRFTTEYDYTSISRCVNHKRYKAMLKPRADCEHCHRIWEKRIMQERQQGSDIFEGF